MLQTELLSKLNLEHPKLKTEHNLSNTKETTSKEKIYFKSFYENPTNENLRV